MFDEPKDARTIIGAIDDRLAARRDVVTDLWFRAVVRGRSRAAGKGRGDNSTAHRADNRDRGRDHRGDKACQQKAQGVERAAGDTADRRPCGDAQRDTHRAEDNGSDDGAQSGRANGVVLEIAVNNRGIIGAIDMDVSSSLLD